MTRLHVQGDVDDDAGEVQGLRIGLRSQDFLDVLHFLAVEEVVAVVVFHLFQQFSPAGVDLLLQAVVVLFHLPPRGVVVVVVQAVHGVDLVALDDVPVLVHAVPGDAVLLVTDVDVLAHDAVLADPLDGSAHPLFQLLVTPDDAVGLDVGLVLLLGEISHGDAHAGHGQSAGLRLLTDRPEEVDHGEGGDEHDHAEAQVADDLGNEGDDVEDVGVHCYSIV